MRNKIEAGLQKLHYYTRTPEGQNDLGRETAKNVVRTLGILFAIGLGYNAIRIAEGGMGIRGQDVQQRDEIAYLTHVVQKGENLFRIGFDYGMTADYLACVNGIIDKSLIFPKQKIRIPLTPVLECDHLK